MPSRYACVSTHRKRANHVPAHRMTQGCPEPLWIERRGKPAFVVPSEGVNYSGKGLAPGYGVVPIRQIRYFTVVHAAKLATSQNYASLNSNHRRNGRGRIKASATRQASVGFSVAFPSVNH